jgi:hypothetical protein
MTALMLMLRSGVFALFVMSVNSKSRADKRDFYGKQEKIQDDSKEKRADQEKRNLDKATNARRAQAKNNQRVNRVHYVNFINFHTGSLA